MEKIDKSFYNDKWFSLYPDSYMICLLITSFGHSPLLNEMFKEAKYKKHVFKFKNMWLLNEHFLDIVKQNWSLDYSSLKAFKLCS